MFHETNDFEKTLFENITMELREDIQDDIKHKNSSPETIGGPASKGIFGNTSMDAKHANELRHTGKKLTIHYTQMRSPTHHGNIFQSISLGNYLNQMASTPS